MGTAGTAKARAAIGTHEELEPCLRQNPARCAVQRLSKQPRQLPRQAHDPEDDDHREQNNMTIHLTPEQERRIQAEHSISISTRGNSGGWRQSDSKALLSD